MGVSQVINLLRIANNQLPSVQDRYEQLQKQNNQFESILKTKPKELQDLNSLIAETSKNLDAIKLEYKREAALLQGLQQQTARLEAFVYNYKNNDEEYIKVINSIEKKGTGLLSDKKAFLKLAIFSLIQSMNPLSSTSSNILDMKGSGQVILPTATIR
jgi:chromosome segregation ATPase